MNLKVEQVGRMDRDFLRHVYGIRKQVFEQEFKFPKNDRMVYNEWDALSNHYLIVVDGEPSGSVAIVDWTGLTDMLEQYYVDPKLKVAKATKLAILPHARGVKTLQTLIEPLREEVKEFDYVAVDVWSPSNNPNDPNWCERVQKYQRVFDLQFKGKQIIDGVETHILGKEIIN